MAIRFRITYDDNASLTHSVCNWTRAGAWGTLFRNISRGDHGNSSTISTVLFESEAQL